jgi:hypothetical protein
LVKKPPPLTVRVVIRTSEDTKIKKAIPKINIKIDIKFLRNF